MQVLTVVPQVLSVVTGTVVSFTDKVPEAKDVKAGWLAFGIFIGLALAVAFLGFSLVKQLKKAQAAKDAGVYGDEPVDPADQTEAEHNGEDAPA